jgi:hypothetical protein
LLYLCTASKKLHKKLHRTDAALIESKQQYLENFYALGVDFDSTRAFLSGP